MRIVLLAIILSPLAVGQIPDTTHASTYFPLEAGNLWEYERYMWPYGPPVFLGYTRRSVDADSTIEGIRYSSVRRIEYDMEGQVESIDVKLLRIDAVTSRIMMRDGEEDIPWYPCPLDADFESSIVCAPDFSVEVYGSPGSEIDFGGYAFGPLKEFETELWAGNYTFEFAAGLGPVRYYQPGTGGLASLLVFARIGGATYGNAIPVSSDPSPAGPTPLALTVYPNPAPAGATVAFDLPAAQEVAIEVFDVLGRRVRQQGLGALPAGEHDARLALEGLPAGLFVVRLTGDAGAVATARLVRQRGE